MKEYVVGLGDAVEKVLSAVGITKDRVRKYLGACGCEQRRVKLNMLGTWASRWAAKIILPGWLGGDKKAARAELLKLMGEEEKEEVS